MTNPLIYTGLEISHVAAALANTLIVHMRSPWSGKSAQAQADFEMLVQLLTRATAAIGTGPDSHKGRRLLEDVLRRADRHMEHKG